jgi:hypothetical protein
MERNSIGQVIIKESGSLLLSIPCITSTISVNTYNRFLLDEREFTELTPTIDKDALINRLESELFIANVNLTREQINIRGGCNVGITNEQVVKGSINRQKITFDTDSGIPYYNAIQSNGLPVYNLSEQAAILYEGANSRRFYTLRSTIKYRYRYIGQNQATKTTTRTFMRFFKDNSGGNGQTIGPGVDRIDNIAGVYNPGDVTGLYTINLEKNEEGLGGITDRIFVGLASPLEDFEMVIYPGSTFTVIPE